MNDPIDVFISYRSDNRQSAYAIVRALEGRGYTVFDPLRDFTPGDDAVEFLRSVLRRSTLLVAVIPAPDDPQDEWTDHRWEEWHEPSFVERTMHQSGLTPRVVPVYLTVFRDGEVPKAWTKLISLHLEDLSDADAIIEPLARALVRAGRRPAGSLHLPTQPSDADRWIEVLGEHLASEMTTEPIAIATDSEPTLRRTVAVGEWLGLRLTEDANGTVNAIAGTHPTTGTRLLSLRRVDQLQLPWPPPETHTGRWMVLLGENGTGKTTILRALALAHLDDSVASACLGTLAGSLVRHGNRHGVVMIGGADGESRVRIVSHAHRVDELGRSRLPPSSDRPVFAYGCQRGSALGGARREVDLRPLAQVATLFDERASLLPAGRWLADERNRMRDGGPAARFARVVVDTVCKVLCEMLPGVERVTVEADGPIVEGPAVGRVELAALSDGYLSTIGWVVDLMARWVEIAREREEVIEPRFNTTMTGLVLIDEVDEHLHPRWQVELLPTIRKLFPRLDFVVTTHNPMTLRGARPGEVVVLEDDDGRVRARQVDLAPGARADQVLTGPWFQLSSALVDEETLRLYREHAAMLRAGAAPNDPQRLALEADLRERLDHFAETAEERVALEIASKHMQGYAALDHREREAVRSKIQAIFDRRMKSGEA